MAKGSGGGGRGGRVSRASFTRQRAAIVRRLAESKRTGDNDGKHAAIAAMNELDYRARELPAARRRSAAWNAAVNSGKVKIR